MKPQAGSSHTLVPVKPRCPTALSLMNRPPELPLGEGVSQPSTQVEPSDL